MGYFGGLSFRGFTAYAGFATLKRLFFPQPLRAFLAGQKTAVSMSFTTFQPKRVQTLLNGVIPPARKAAGLRSVTNRRRKDDVLFQETTTTTDNAVFVYLGERQPGGRESATRCY